MNIEQILVNKIKEAIKTKYDIDNDSLVMVERPKDENNGDYSTNIAMRICKLVKSKPQDVAQALKDELEKNKEIEKIEIAGPGFINFWIKKGNLAAIINTVLDKKEDYGKSNYGNNTKYLQEYVSANPTGPLHCGHARGAVWGDSVARIMKKAGYKIDREYYINDAGVQIKNLGISVYERYKELYGKTISLPEDGYHGPDIIETAKEIQKEYGDKFLNMDEDKAIEELANIAKLIKLRIIKEDLKYYGCEFDSWISEKWIYEQGKVEDTVKRMKDKNLLYEQDGAIWFKSEQYGDEKDRVLKKSDGTYTYMTPDIANHIYKYERGYDVLVNIWGADHHGYIPRMKAALKALGYNEKNLQVDLCQMVRMMEDGKEVKMSKRTGNAITLRELIDDIGLDSTRYFFLSKALDTHLDFDMDLARTKSNENPVYYAQYAYARICSIIKQTGEPNKKETYEMLTHDKEADLLKHIAAFEETIITSAKERAPHKICNYIQKLAALFHSFYGTLKINDPDNKELSNERLALVKATQITLKNALTLLGVSAPEKM